MSHVIIVGGGASGLVAAIMAARRKHKVTILEHKDKIGKKILATGNGKCNYTNLVQTPQNYRGNGTDFAMKVLANYDVNKTIDFFMELGIYAKEKNGYVYPNSEQASSVVEVLKSELEWLKVNIICNAHVEQIQQSQNQFILITNQGNYKADKVILSTGGCASPKLGSDGSGYGLAKKLGHTVITPLPALVQLKSDEKYFKTLSGVRTKAHIQLYIENKFIAEEKGELLIAAYGVSGIPIFALSRYAAKAINEKKKVYLLIDILTVLGYEEALDLLLNRVKRNPAKTIEAALIGLINNKLAYVSLKEAGLNPDTSCNLVNEKQLKDLVLQLKQWKVTITEPNSFEQAQVSAGGIDTREINGETMESKKVKGLFLTGELIDVDGTCGGYNLQWAWSSGVIAGLNA